MLLVTDLCKGTPVKLSESMIFTPLNEAWSNTMIPTVIASGFSRSRIYPFNPKVLDYGASKGTLQETTVKLLAILTVKPFPLVP